MLDTFSLGTFLIPHLLQSVSVALKSCKDFVGFGYETLAIINHQSFLKHFSVANNIDTFLVETVL